MREIKFRCWNTFSNTMHSWDEMVKLNKIHLLAEQKESYPVTQYTGLKDKNGVEIYIGYVLQFDNGDTVIVETEDWMEVFVTPIGEVKCEDQWRDLYRIEMAQVIGNIYQNPELLEKHNAQN